MPLTGYGGDWNPIEVSEDEFRELHTLMGVNSPSHEMIEQILGSDRYARILQYTEESEAQAALGYACICGCGCRERHHHPTSSYCKSCREGRCGE